ncbi:hypothetical protein BHE74_00048373 [Ensete ventricosum]|nr:hypothetical protein BHE74_00048373 [Ensete ventricosum]RZR86056.1 hypothetical protein BHM03_00013147 [Ensete ventricosum]
MVLGWAGIVCRVTSSKAFGGGWRPILPGHGDSVWAQKRHKCAVNTVPSPQVLHLEMKDHEGYSHVVRFSLVVPEALV